jgi:hypothetical protein
MSEMSLPEAIERVDEWRRYLRKEGSLSGAGYRAFCYVLDNADAVAWLQELERKSEPGVGIGVELYAGERDGEQAVWGIEIEDGTINNYEAPTIAEAVAKARKARKAQEGLV